jgi:hypothetical protein
MEENKQKLDELIAQTLEALEVDPDNEQLLEKLDTLYRLAITDYSEANKAYVDETKANTELELKKRELDLKEAELAQNKKEAIWNRVFRALGIAAPFAVGMATIHADRVGEYIHKIALPWASKFGRDN